MSKHARFAWLLILTMASACGGDDAPANDAGAAADAALPEMDGTSLLTDCSMGAAEAKWCVPEGMRESARWRFDFACPRTSLWRVEMGADPNRARLSVVGQTIASYGESAPPTLLHEINFASLEDANGCTAFVDVFEPLAFTLTLTELDGALDQYGCEEECLRDSAVGTGRGCDCSSTCHDACTDKGADCGLPCNADNPNYLCPYLEADISADTDCTYYASDTDAFEHVGRCYRCGDGQQCCYSDGRDNGTGSFDICPPLDPGPNDPDPFDCSGVSDHCKCDVVPLCGCMAQVGAMALCGECVGESNFDFFSCNAPGDDATFCQRAKDAATAGFDWCAILGDPMTCFDRPFGF